MPPDTVNCGELQALLDRGEWDAQAHRLLLAQATGQLERLTRKMLRAYPRLRRWEETDDVFQTAALRLYQSLSQVRPRSVREFFGLAAVQVRRTLLDLARHHFGPEGAAGHHRSVDLEFVPPEGERATPPAASGRDDAGPETLVEWSEFHEMVERLPEEERDIFHLVWYAGLPQKDIAELMHISVPTVQRRWTAARLALYDLLHGESPAAEDAACR